MWKPKRVDEVEEDISSYKLKVIRRINSYGIQRLLTNDSSPGFRYNSFGSIIDGISFEGVKEEICRKWEEEGKIWMLDVLLKNIEKLMMNFATYELRIMKHTKHEERGNRIRKRRYFDKDGFSKK